MASDALARIGEPAVPALTKALSFKEYRQPLRTRQKSSIEFGSRASTCRKRQPFGTKARENLAEKVFKQKVRVEVIDVDRYKREVGRLYLGERFLNLEMVRDGFAWRYVQYDKPGEFSAAETDACEHWRGLWADPNPGPPWEGVASADALLQSDSSFVACDSTRSAVCD
jgi:endonuclease YncB( thermonuclease family)